MTAPALRLATVRKSFGRTEIIRGVDLVVQERERHAIIGPNGAGKSTLFNLISARFPVSSGSIELKGEDVTGLCPFEVHRRGLSRSFQISNIFHNLSVFDNVRCAVLWSLGYRYSFWHLLSRLRDAGDRADGIIEAIGLSRRRATPASVLSYAEQRALEIGITIAGGAEVILLDEPTAALGVVQTKGVLDLIRRVRDRGLGVVFISHQMPAVLQVADEVQVMRLGRRVAKYRAKETTMEELVGAMTGAVTQENGS